MTKSFALVAALLLVCTASAWSCDEQWPATRDTVAPLLRVFPSLNGGNNGIVLERRKTLQYYVVNANGLRGLVRCPHVNACVVGTTTILGTSFAFVRTPATKDDLSQSFAPNREAGVLLVNPQVHLDEITSMNNGPLTIAEVSAARIEVQASKQLARFARGGAIIVDPYEFGFLGIALTNGAQNRVFVRAPELQRRLDAILAKGTS